MKMHVVCTGVVWLASPVTIGLNCHLALIATYLVWFVLIRNRAPDKHTAWNIHNVKHKTHPEGEKICSPTFSSSVCFRLRDVALNLKMKIHFYTYERPSFKE